MRKLHIPAALATALILFPVGAGAFVHYDFEQPIFSEQPLPILDHCVVEQDGVYHLFYLRGNPAVNIGHATTTDFVHWTTLDPVLTPGTWNAKLWAPYLVPNPAGGWFMYYTGVNDVSAQQTGLAFSSDLSAWGQLPYPIYHPSTSWALWDSTTFSHGRDPHILDYNGRHYMFVTAKTIAGLGAVAGAVSDDWVHWQDIGPIYVHYTWHVLESVFILKHASKWHMFFTEETVGGTTDMTSDSLLSGWDYNTHRIIDFGHAPQITETNQGELFSRHAVYNDQHGNYLYYIGFSPLVWLGDVPAVPRPLPLASDWTQVSGDAFYYQPTFGNNAAVRNQGYAKSWVGDGWINTYEYYTGPFGYGAPGGTAGDGRTGMIRSATFSIQGNSMTLLVGGGDYPNECYVALVDADTGEVLFRETGKNSDVMDKRSWNLRPYIGRSVYIEIADLSTASFGHIDVDEIVESPDMLSGGGTGSGRARITPSAPRGGGNAQHTATVPGPARLLANVPNPFNPLTSIFYEIPRAARVRIDVYDARGGLVRTLLDATESAGRHEERWDGTDGRGDAMASGVYFYRLRVDGHDAGTRKMALLK